MVPSPKLAPVGLTDDGAAAEDVAAGSWNWASYCRPPLRAVTGLEDLVTFMNVSLSAPVAPAADTVTGGLGVLGARFVLDGGPSQGRFSLVEHPIIARGMAAPLHLHTREDEYSFILEGRWGFWQGGNVVHAEPGDLVYKPRDVWHTFWNATDGPARLLEIISPAGFDQFFIELAALISSGRPARRLSGRLTPPTGCTSIPKAPPGSPPNIAW